MTITIDLTPDQEAQLRSQAIQRGQDPETIAQGDVFAGLDAPAPQDVSEEDHERLVQRLLDLGMMTERALLSPLDALARPEGRGVSL